MKRELPRRTDFLGWLGYVIVGAVVVGALGSIAAFETGRWYIAVITIVPYLAIVSVQARSYASKLAG